MHGELEPKNHSSFAISKFHGHSLLYLVQPFATLFFITIITPGFLVSREVTLTNTSEIPMTYQLRVSQPSTGHGLPAGSPTTAAIISDPEENSTEASDFQIIPSSGTLPPNFHQTIQVYTFYHNKQLKLLSFLNSVKSIKI